MQTFKIENFKKSHPGKAFPSYISQSREKCAGFRRELASRLGVSPDATSADVLTRLHQLPSKRLGAVPGSGAVDLRGLLHDARIGLPDEVYVNWYRFDDVDRMALVELEEHFDDIWYPSSDDIEIFDDTLDWFLVVSHDGVITMLENSKLRRDPG